MVKKKPSKVVRLKKNSGEELTSVIIHGIQEKKGKEILSLDMRNVKNAVADFFVVCHGDSRPQVEAIARSVEEEVYRKLKEDPFHKEGKENAEWVLIDYFNVVVHVFLKEKREFYGIERLWADAEIKMVANS
jgi:ribosome-associated protein